MVEYGRRKKPLTTAVPLRLSPSARKSGQRICAVTGMQFSQVLRLSIARGLPILERQLGVKK